MPAIGIDVAVRLARVVIVDEHANVLTSTSHRADDSAHALNAALEATKQPTAPVGIAMDDPPASDAGKQSAAMFRTSEALATGEAWAGAARGARHAICLWLGDRVAAGVLLNGSAWAGAHGLAGQAAWLALNPVERQDYRKFGSFAAEVNDAGIARRLTWRVQAGDESIVVERAGGLDKISAKHVFDGARESDGVAISVVRDTARYIAMAAVNLAIAVDPEVVVIGGPITSASDLLADALRQDFDRRLPPRLVSKVRCEFSTLGEDAIALGAARLAMVARG
jgi:glucokinase